jgi:heterotetrameric sarcosine oxidase delta subunit
LRIPCPFCGERDVHEFAVRGEVPAGPRPDPDAPDAQARFYDWVYLRDNPMGPDTQHWYHAYGCRRWLEVRRDNRTHEILGVKLAPGAHAGGAA